MQVAVIGGGAAGFFAALNIHQFHPDAKVSIFEKTGKLLSKVKVSGGGRCNVTTDKTNPKELVNYYPRGKKELISPFFEFNPTHTEEWFKAKGIDLKTETDGRVFPKSNSSQTIIDCFLNEAKKLNIDIQLHHQVQKIIPKNEQLQIDFTNGKSMKFDKVIVAMGGHHKEEFYNIFKELGHTIISPIPSLFTFNLPNNPIVELMGISIENAIVTIPKTKQESTGPLLITHWGMSGPAVLKLSAICAKELFASNYQFSYKVNWLSQSFNQILEQLQQLKKESPKKQLVNLNQFGLPNRLWEFLLKKANINAQKNAAELSTKEIEQLAATLTKDEYQANGKTTFKEEFVTAGGIDLKEIDFKTMQSKKVKNLYFAGEVLNIDGLTGGFNFQACWTGGYIAAQLAD